MISFRICPALQEVMTDTRESPIVRKSDGGDKVQECYWVPVGCARFKELVQMVYVCRKWARRASMLVARTMFACCVLDKSIIVADFGTNIM